MISCSFRRTLVALALLAWPCAVFALPDPTLQWSTITTEHFEVHFHEGAEWTARQVATIAEEIRKPINDVYQYDPGKCHFVIMDTDDYANGAAYFYDNKIEIWATNLEFGLRGTTEWLWNVVTHEYTHIVSIQAGMKMPRWLPAVYFQWIHFETEKRPDVITGYPNAIMSYPITGVVIPPWWAEGVAQYQSPYLKRDCWDTHRDMILRAAVTDGKALSPNEMGYLGHRSLGNEMVYDHGYSLVRYIAETYGDDALRRIADSLGRVNRLTMDGALKEATGKKFKELYADWMSSLAARYDRQLAPVRDNLRSGTVIDDVGFMVYGPSYSPDGTRVVYLSNRESDFSGTSLIFADADGKNQKSLGRASSSGVFSPDGKKIVYARHNRVNKYGAMVSDIYEYDIATEDERRITHGARAAEPSYSPDGRTIVCVINGDGTHRLGMVASEGNVEPRVILEGEPGTQYYTPRYSPDGRRILVGVFRTGTRDIATVSTNGSDFEYLIRTPNDERDAAWSASGDAVIFASDRTGIFNLYRLDLDTGTVAQLTNVIGGAFTPGLTPDNATVAFAHYTADGYKLYSTDTSGPVAELNAETYAERATGEFENCVPLKADNGHQRVSAWEAHAPVDVHNAGVAPVLAPGGMPLSIASADSLELSGVVDSDITPYKYKYTDFQLYPRVVIWDGVLRLGAFVASNEILDKVNFFASGSYGMDGGFDMIFSFQLRKLWPVLYIDFFRFRQKYAEEVDVELRHYFLDIRYDLWAIEPGLRFEFEDPWSSVFNHDLSLWYSRSEYRVFLEPEYTDSTVSTGQRFPDSSVGWTYFKGNEFNLQWHVKMIRPALDSDINPRSGRDIRLRLMYANDELFSSGEFDYGFRPSFDTNKFGQYTLDWHEYIAMPYGRHSLALRGMTSYIDNTVDDFFWVYMGGMDGIRGYTYYTLGGRAGALASATYRFPVARGLDKRFSWMMIKDIYGGAFFELANAWSNEGFELQGYKRSAGYEVRLNMTSWYAFPTTVGFTGAYALDSVIFANPLFPENSIVNEPRWQYYFTMGFTF